jgi:hypothetical protein
LKSNLCAAAAGRREKEREMTDPLQGGSQRRIFDVVARDGTRALFNAPVLLFAPADDATTGTSGWEQGGRQRTRNLTSLLVSFSLWLLHYSWTILMICHFIGSKKLEKLIPSKSYLF